MNMNYLVVQLVIAIACGIVGNMLIPRELPGKFLGLVLVGLLGVWLGAWSYHLLKARYGLDFAILQWQIEGVPIVPSILGSAIVIYVLTGFLQWGRYGK